MCVCVYVCVYVCVCVCGGIILTFYILKFNLLMNYLDKYNNMKLAFNNKVFINIL